MDKEIKNLSVSVRQRLYNIAKKSGSDFNFIVNRFMQERFLYRLSISLWHDHYILKGGLLMLLNDADHFRPTKDIDFLGLNIPNDLESTKDIISRITEIPVKDSVQFDQSSINVQKIIEGADYEGIRVNLTAFLGTMKVKLQIDIGFGDIIYNGPIETSFPVLLDFPVPSIRSYPFETVIAEKFQLIVKLDIFTSRMKDFYDIMYLASIKTFNRKYLSIALRKTFDNRKTDITSYSNIFSDSFMNNENKHVQWNAFLHKFDIPLHLSFYKVLEKLRIFLVPALDNGDNTRLMNWDNSNWKWHD
jgi:predicted nucleotidyltransferase component of viral defense system